MRAIDNWGRVQKTTDFTPLPVGGYVCRIQGAKIREGDNANGHWESLDIAFDIIEGEYSGFYRQDYDRQSQEDKRWRGVFKLFFPKGDGSRNDEYSASRFKDLACALEESNPGYHWDWDESKLKNKLIGIVFRNEEWEYNGNTGWKAQPFKAYEVEAIRQNKFKLPKERALKGNSNTAAALPKFEDAVEIENDDDLPF